MVDGRGLEEFFRDSLDGLGGLLSSESSFYVVSTFAGFSRRVPLESMGPLLMSRGDDPSLLQEIGDSAIFVSSVFPLHLERRGLSVGYLDLIGASSYSRLGRMMAGRSRCSEVFLELSGAYVPVRRTCAEAAAGWPGIPGARLHNRRS